MERTYTQAQLVSFGNYVLNTNRVQDAMDHAKVGSDGELDTEFITQVYDADLANWSIEQNLQYNVDPEKNHAIAYLHRGNTLEGSMTKGYKETGESSKGLLMLDVTNYDINEHQG